jgi:hypothetical protein
MSRLLLALALLTSTVSAATEDDAMTQEEFRFVCRALGVIGYKVQCHGLRPPTVVVSKIVGDVAVPPGVLLRGVTYDDEVYIFVNPELSRAEQRVVVIHEAVHYVLLQTFGPAIPDCENEAAARTVHRLWQGLPPDESWRTLYGC